MSVERGGRLGILAGSGELPRMVADAARKDGRDPFIIAFEGYATPETVAGFPHAFMRLGSVGHYLKRLRKEGVSEVVTIGHVRRPSWRTLRPDVRGAMVMARIMLHSGGDDRLLRIVREEIEHDGFVVRGADEFLPQALALHGTMGRVVPEESFWSDIQEGARIAHAIGALDIGQAIVIQEGVVLGVEGIEGTNALIQRCAGLKREGRSPILVKMKKPQQDRRMDLPAMGVETVRNAADAGFAGIAMEAGGVLVARMEATIAAADAAGIFVVGI
ncbi:MAG TPA: DUF1009 domain-containing protein [Rhodospirillaceae bacterium]|nr:MAG: hypothetical protein A2018_04095 [Alphaproteobacteria bacterium GWF2_58_20]HAU28493.1 DUF1009 domain-containing protein [Rhodospirillaceae bacterium]